MVAGDPLPYFAGSGLAALMTFPLWKAATIEQASFQLRSTSIWSRIWECVRPPWKGSFVVVGGMTWQRAAIFFGSDAGIEILLSHGVSPSLSRALPPLLVPACVQFTIQPLVRATVMLQDPRSTVAVSSALPTLAMLNHIRSSRGCLALWHGTHVGIFRTAPKYAVAISMKDVMDQVLAPADESCKSSALWRSAKKSVAAGLAAAFFTNPFDVVRNEMFKTEESLANCLTRLHKDAGLQWMLRGGGKNLIANAVPIFLTVFLTDAFADWLQTCRQTL